MKEKSYMNEVMKMGPMKKGEEMPKSKKGMSKGKAKKKCK